MSMIAERTRLGTKISSTSLFSSHVTSLSRSRRVSSSGSSTHPPRTVAIRTSTSATSKLIDEKLAIRCGDGPSDGAEIRSYHLMRFTRAEPGITTAFGSPVDPEV